MALCRSSPWQISTALGRLRRPSGRSTSCSPGMWQMILRHMMRRWTSQMVAWGDWSMLGPRSLKLKGIWWSAWRMAQWLAWHVNDSLKLWQLPVSWYTLIKCLFWVSVLFGFSLFSLWMAIFCMKNPSFRSYDDRWWCCARCARRAITRCATAIVRAAIVRAAIIVKWHW